MNTQNFNLNDLFKRGSCLRFFYHFTLSAPDFLPFNTISESYIYKMTCNMTPIRRQQEHLAKSHICFETASSEFLLRCGELLTPNLLSEVTGLS